MLRVILIAVLLVMAGAPLARATDATVCPATQADSPPTDWPPSDWTASGCETLTLSQFDPTDRFVWVRTALDAPDTDAPLSLVISGRFASRVWINGQEVGRNGLPGPDARSEAPGLMDGAVLVPQGLVRTGENEVVLLASAHHGFIHLAHPFHSMHFRPLAALDRSWIARLSPVMIGLGILLAGLAYFSGLAMAGMARRDTLMLAGLSALAAGQLVAETARTVWAYPYPVHDIRLLAIAGFSAGFGVLACAYVTRRLWPERFVPVVALAAALSIAALIFKSGFDGKSAFAMLGPLGVAALVSLRGTFRAPPPHRRRAAVYLAALLLFIAANVLHPTLFLDALFFYLVAGLLGLLLVEQARERSRDQAETLAEKARADRLQLLLETLEPDVTAPPLTIRSAGRVEQIPVSDIVRLQSADGYAEIVLTDGRRVLHSKSLAALDDELPASFLKVHRSHLVNTAHVRALDRDGSGTGSLVLATGERVPVSRRILPSVRQILT